MTSRAQPDRADAVPHSFAKDYWEEHWVQAHDPVAAANESTANPHLVREAGGLTPGTALDAGCGTGAEAIWLATRGWRVTGADISANALALAADAPGARDVTWVQADLTTWAPTGRFDLVVTSYAHPAIPQLDFYDRISDWVAPGGTLLIIGHLRQPAAHGQEEGHRHADASGHHPPAGATVTLTDITERLDPAVWRIDSSEESTRTFLGPAGASLDLHDAVVRATRSA